MRLINKESVTRVVDECYPSSSYKIFTINSKNGIDKCDPIGLFVSLGITTSMKTLHTVSRFIDKILSTKSCISEIESRVINGEYINSISIEEVLEQYDSENCYDKDSSNIYDKSGIIELIYKIRDKISNSNEIDDILKYSRELTKISRIVKRINSNNWSDYIIQINEGDSEDINISITNKKVNYSKVTKADRSGNTDVVHKRIGILIKF